MDIEDSECVEILNWLPKRRANAAVRSGYSPVQSADYSEALSSVFSYSPDAVTRITLAGTATGIAKSNGSVLTAIPISDGSYNSSSSPWKFRQYKAIAYAVRASTGTMKRTDGSSVSDAGIDAPDTAPTIAEGASGDLDAGDYRAVYTYYNTNTGQESNYSPVSDALTLGASKKIDWSGIVVSTNPQVTHIRLYRTLPDQQGQYFFVDSIDNFTTTYTGDNDIIEDLGSRASTRNGLPPANAELMEVFLDRMWLSDGVDAFFSEVGLMESFAAASFISVFPDDGHRIKGLLAFGSRLIVGKTNAVHFITGSDRDTFAVKTLADRDGVVGDSMRTASGLLFWCSGSKVIQSQGSGITDISSPRVSDLLDRINPAAHDAVAAGISPQETTYYLHLPLDSATTPSHTLAYNWDNDTWAVMQWNSNTAAPVWMDTTVSTTGAEVLYGIFSGGLRIQNMLSGTDDNGTDITAYFDTKAFGFENDSMQHGVRRLSVSLYPAKAANLTVSVIRDADGTLYKSRTVSINSDGWKTVGISTMDELHSLTQFRVSYTGKTGLRCAGLAAKLVAFRRPPPIL
jgi:hypothetical protein